MASMRDIKRRRTSISSTQQITKAMKLVSTVKLQKAKTHAEETTPYFNHTYSTVCSILAKAGTVNHPYLQKSESQKKAVITITSNRGLAGGYNSNVVKLITGSDFAKEDVLIYAIGKKGEEALAHRDYEIAAEYNDVMEAPAYMDAQAICTELLKMYSAGEIGEIYLAYTHFKNTVVHVPTLLKLLPVEVDEADIEEQKSSNLMMNFEPNEEEALSLIIPKYISSMIYGALIEAVASENGARMQAMDSATSNAEDMISDLTLKYNRARQGSITQELTEIIAGAEALA
ncbi:MAG: ATP synthase F1 subunit gamma [Lachnospiraceae bacterium]|nr:ATP synthase F1 subunit gamma [Lachnospiraceae bacterium]